MELVDLFEGRWWDDSPTVTLYHGTSSALVPAIRAEGLRPLPDDLRPLVAEVLRDIMGEVPPGLLDRALAYAERRRPRGDGVIGPKRSALYFYTKAKDVRGYAIGYATIGGEMASDIGNFLYHEGIIPRPPHRWPDAQPVIIEVEVPKAWVIPNDFDRMKRVLTAHWDQRNPIYTNGFASLEDMLDEEMERHEMRVARPIPPEMITRIFLARDDPPGPG